MLGSAEAACKETLPACMCQRSYVLLPFRLLEHARLVCTQAVAALAPGFEVDDAVQDNALQQMARDFVMGAVTLGCGVARRRGALRLEASDMSAYMENNWCVPF